MHMFVLQAENSGDPWEYDKVYKKDYFTILYYLVVSIFLSNSKSF